MVSKRPDSGLPEGHQQEASSDIIYLMKNDVMVSPEAISELKAQYGYLDHIPQEGWLWEFIRRNVEYQSLYSYFEQSSIELLYDAQTVTAKSLDKDTAHKLKLLQRKFFIASTMRGTDENGDCYLIKKLSGERHEIAIPNPKCRYCDMMPKPEIRGSTPVVATKFREKELEILKAGDKEKFNKYCYRRMNKISPSFDLRDTLYIGISLSAKKDDLKENLNKLIDKHVTPLKVKYLPEKWRYYLIAFDLREITPKKSYPEIGEILAQMYPEMGGLFDYVTVQNYKKNASALIYGEFQKFLYV